MEESRPRRLLVTGGAGFIGSCVVAAALGDGDASGDLERVIVLDICDRALVAKVFADLLALAPDGQR